MCYNARVATKMSAGRPRGRGMPKGTKLSQGARLRRTQEAEDLIIARLPDVIDNLFDLASRINEKGMVGHARQAAQYLIDRGLGRPAETTKYQHEFPQNVLPWVPSHTQLPEADNIVESTAVERPVEATVPD